MSAHKNDSFLALRELAINCKQIMLSWISKFFKVRFTPRNHKRKSLRMETEREFERFTMTPSPEEFSSGNKKHLTVKLNLFLSKLLCTFDHHDNENDNNNNKLYFYRFTCIEICQGPWNKNDVLSESCHM